MLRILIAASLLTGLTLAHAHAATRSNINVPTSGPQCTQAVTDARAMLTGAAVAEKTRTSAAQRIDTAEANCKSGDFAAADRDLTVARTLLAGE
ncbi:MAG: hypothetical protein LPL00_06445 [Alphaproteobacteria bacterium]|nr:hypothetical protein [Alphaproteobacteria bacterium]MDX5369186.1 hypothetical protein [Alphaproteobacteria bacterium]MDX5463882.1 hypothetical protein [Alphaproteobacteria bacterium]